MLPGPVAFASLLLFPPKPGYYLDSNLSHALDLRCYLGQVTFPLWASIVTSIKGGSCTRWRVAVLLSPCKFMLPFTALLSTSPRAPLLGGALPWPQESCGSSSRSLSKRPALGLLPSSGPGSAPCGLSERLAPSPAATPHFSVFPFFFSLSFPELTRSRCGARWLERWGEEEGGWTASQTGGEGRGVREREAGGQGPPHSHSCASEQPQGQSPVTPRIWSLGKTDSRDQRRARWSEGVEAQEAASERARDQAQEARVCVGGAQRTNSPQKWRRGERKESKEGQTGA